MIKVQREYIASYREIHERLTEILSGKPVELEEVLGKEIVVTAYVKFPSSVIYQGEEAIIQAYCKDLNPTPPHYINFATDYPPLIAESYTPCGDPPFIATLIKSSEGFRLI